MRNKYSRKERAVIVGLVADNSVCKTDCRLYGFYVGAYMLNRIIAFVVCDSLVPLLSAL